MKSARKLHIAVSPVPAGYHTVTTALTIRGASDAIRFYEKAFGAEVLDRFDGPDGKSVMHAALRIGDSIVFLADEFPGWGTKAPATLGGSTGSIYLYLPDVDAAFKRAVAAGAKPVNEVDDKFYGDRSGTVVDPFGFRWELATHVEDVPPDEMKRRGAAFLEEMSGRK